MVIYSNSGYNPCPTSTMIPGDNGLLGSQLEDYLVDIKALFVIEAW
jgi:hypothetical protein